MANELRFDGRVAIITGAGNGLGRSHALLLGSRGAKVVVNDLGGSAFGDGKSSSAADKVVEEIRALGGEAVANYDSVEDGDRIVKTALDAFGQVDIVVNNAGILRDTTFQKMTPSDWDLIMKVHVNGAFRVTHAAWNHMRERGYGRVIFTASAAGIYGNFGQANYSTAKLGLVGLSNTLALEGQKKNVRVNTIAPIAGSRLTETVLPQDLIDALKPEYVSALVAYLCHEACEETGGLFEVGGGFMGKLRWERSAGHTFRLSRSLTPELVKKHWSAISGFEKTTHPEHIAASMQPILDNLPTAKGKGGNDLIDVDEALGYEFEPVASSYTERDLSLYALAVGAAKNPLDAADLRLVYELHGDGFLPMPTFSVVPALNAIFKMGQEGKQAPGLHYGLERVLHGEQYTEVYRPLPTSAKLSHRIKIKDIFDKGKNALVVTAITTTDETGEPLAYNELTTFVRGAGGWGGDRGPQGESNVPPSREPDATVEEATTENQALLYRLCGDWNPLHADPVFAQNFGFPRPILHGLCTFGIVTRHVIARFAKGDPRLFKSIKVRFADSVFPGETIVTEMWKESDSRIILRASVKERGKAVITHAAVELYDAIPKPKPKAVAATAKADAPAHFEPNSADIFAAIEDYLATHKDAAAKIKTSFLFKLTAPDSAWTIDTKVDPPEVAPSAKPSPDVTLELSDADFLAMTTGKADPQKLYFGGKLKITGNIMASQKLEFLKKMDPEQAMRAMLKKRGAAPAAPATAAAVSAEQVFGAIAHHIEANPDLVAKVGTVFQWRLKGPDSDWVLDLKNGKGSAGPGVADKPDTTLELSHEDFIAMSTGKADPQKLYFSGKLKISGNVMASQKLEFLKKVDRSKAVSVAAKPAATSAEAAPSPKQAKSPAIFDALRARLAENPSLHSEVGARVLFQIRSPDARYAVDLTQSPGIIGDASGPSDCTITLSDDDLIALCKDPSSAMSMYMQGKMRVDGDPRIAARLGLLKDLV